MIGDTRTSNNPPPTALSSMASRTPPYAKFPIKPGKIPWHKVPRWYINVQPPKGDDSRSDLQTCTKQINKNLNKKVEKYRQSKQLERNAELLLKGHKQQRRQIVDDGLIDISDITGNFRVFVA